MKQKTRKYLIIALGVVVLAVVALGVLARMLITPERIKTALIPRVEKALNRPVEIGEVDFSFFSGITLRDLTIRERATEDVFLSAGQVSLDYQFWPLLKKRIIVDEVLLRQPHIRVERMADGTFNFSDLRPAAEGSEIEPPPVETDQEQQDIDLVISTVLLRDGVVEWVDHAAGEDEFRYQLQELDLQISDLSLVEEFPWRVEALLGDAPLALSGNANLQDKSVRAQVALAGFDVLPFKPYFGEKFPGQLQSLLLDLKLTLAGTPEIITSEGTIQLKNIGMQLQAMPEAPIKNAELVLGYDLRLNLPQSMVEIPQGRISFNGLPLTLAGSITDLKSAAKVDLDLTLPDVEIQQAVAALPAGLVKPLAGLDPAGTLGASFELAGPLAEGIWETLKNGEIRLKDVRADLAGQRAALSGLLRLQGDDLTGENLAVAIGPNRARFDLQARDFTQKPINMTTALTAERFNIDALLAQKEPDGSKSETKGPAKADTGPGKKQEIGPFDLPIRLSGTAVIDQALYKGLTIQQLRSRYYLRDNILVVEELTGKVAGGTFGETARIDLGKKGLEYTARLNTKNIQLDPLVSAFFPKGAGTLFGGLNLNLDLAGRGTTKEVIQQALTAKGDILLQNGKLTGTGLASGLATFLDLSELREINFQQAKGQIALNNGNMAVDSTFAGKQVEMFPKGSVGLDGNLDLDLGLRLSPEMYRKVSGGGKLPSLLKDEKGWGRIPLSVAGTLTSPKFALDSSALQAEAEEKAKQKLQKTLQEKLFDRKKGAESETGQPAEQKPAEPAEELLEGVFKGLFGN
ncbi:MAG: AsmA family protein [Syntrophotaleaceae bacterium]